MSGAVANAAAFLDLMAIEAAWASVPALITIFGGAVA
jgi:hypothetical protein